MKKFGQFILLSGWLLSCSSQAAIMNVATDNADQYGTAWQGNGGSGFDEWVFIADGANGASGGFLASASGNADLNHITSSPNDKAWGSYANGPDFNQFEAYRGFAGNSLLNAGDSFSISLEHGAINGGGSVGFVLRHGNIHQHIGDYNQQALFEFGFLGGAQHYSVFDQYGNLDTGIGFTTQGLNLTFTLLSSAQLSNTQYQLDIFNAQGNSFIKRINGNLSGTGSIDSVALYNRDSEFANAYFNNLAIRKSAISPVDAPASAVLWLMPLLFMAVRRYRLKP